MNFEQGFDAAAFVSEQAQSFCFSTQTYLHNLDFKDLKIAIINLTVTFVAAVIKLRLTLESDRALNTVDTLEVTLIHQNTEQRQWCSFVSFIYTEIPNAKLADVFYR